MYVSSQHVAHDVMKRTFEGRPSMKRMILSTVLSNIYTYIYIYIYRYDDGKQQMLMCYFAIGLTYAHCLQYSMKRAIQSQTDAKDRIIDAQSIENR